MFHNNIVKISEKLTNGTCWKSASKLLTLQIPDKFAFGFSMGKSETIWFLKTSNQNKAFCA